MYKIYSKNVDVKHVSQLRKVAVQGLESIRLIGNHGIDVQLMVYLAKNFERQVLQLFIDHYFKKQKYINTQDKENKYIYEFTQTVN